MALDPNISLSAGKDVPQFDPMAAASKGIQLADLLQKYKYYPQITEQALASQRAAQAATEAGTTGQLIANRQAQRELAARERLAEIAKSNTRVGPGGKVVVDWNAAGQQASQEGHDAGVVFTYLQNGQKTAQENIKTSTDEHKYVEGVLQTAKNLLRVQKDPTQAGAIAKKTLDLLTQTVGPERAKQYASTYWQVPEQPPVNPATGQPDPAAAGAHLIKQANVNAESTISPQQAIANKQTQEQISQTWTSLKQAAIQGNMTEADQRDSSSPRARVLQRAMVDAGMASPEEAKTLTVAQMMNNPAFAKRMDANVIGAETKAGLVVAASGKEAEAENAKNLAVLAKRAREKNASISNLKVKNIIDNKYNQYLNTDPEINAYFNEVRAAAARGELKLDENIGSASIEAIARNKAQVAANQAAKLRQQTKESTFSKSTPVNAQVELDGYLYKKIKAGPNSDKSTWMELGPAPKK